MSFAFFPFIFFFKFLKGLPQNVNIVFNEPIETFDLNTNKLKIKFQGGFVGSVMTLSLENSNNQNVYKKSYYPDDINDMQIFQLNENASITSDKILSNVRKISISFEKSSDFFGRIIIYHLEFLA